MYKSKKWNGIVYASALIVLVAFLLLIREQGGIGDKQFVRSMIPHHSGAILMCREAALRDQELKELCGRIMGSQREEIEQMERILERL